MSDELRLVPVELAATPPVADLWAPLRRATPARIGLGRAGDALPTSRQLELRLAHARARDAVHDPLDSARLTAELGDMGAAGITVASAAPDRSTYLRRPDLGRRLADGEQAKLPPGEAEIAFVIADGLSPHAVHQHAAGVLRETVARLPGWTLAPLVIASQARVALGDEIGAALGVRFVVVLIGERPGLSAADSLGVYLTYAPRVGRSDAERNCISNVRPPAGLSYAVAAGKLAALLIEARRRGLTGVALKDEAADLPDGPLPPAALGS